MENLQPVSKISIDELLAAEIHPLANMLPMASVPEIRAIAFSIKDLGYKKDAPIVFHQGKILDGRNRRKALEMLSQRFEINFPIFKTEFNHCEGSALDYVISSNIARRHLKPSQLAMLASGFHHVKFGENQYSADWGSKLTVAALTKMFNISRSQFFVAKEVKRFGDSGLINDVRSGKRTLHYAMRELGLKSNPEKNHPADWLKGGLISAKLIGTRPIGKLRLGEIDGLIGALKTDLARLRKIKNHAQVDDQLALVCDFVPTTFGRDQ